MPLDSLGLGLTLDTTLLEKADKTLENMHKNSKLIMQNLTKGISAFNSGAITDFADVLNNVQEALSKMDGTKMSIDYDKKGLEEYKRGINDILDLTVRLSEKFGDMQFYDPKRVNRTDESPREVRKRLRELLEEYKTFEAKLNKADEFDADSDKYTKQLTDSKAEIEKLTPSVEKLKEAYEKAKDAYQKYVDTQSQKIREKTPEATDEEIHNVLLSRDAYIKKAKAMLEAQMAYKEEESLLKAQQKLYGDASAAKFFSENRQELEENSAMLRESIKNAAADLAWANKTIAEKDEELLKDQKARDNEEKSRIAGIQSTYKEIRKAIEQGEKELAEAEKRRDTIAKGKGDTSEYDAKIQELKAFLDEKKDIETSWRKSQYWPALEAIDKQFNKKKLEDDYKQRLSSPTVAFANQYSKNATSIDEETQAVKMLEAARDSLSNSTAHYDQVVNALNKRIAKHEDHIKLLTQEQKESKELQDSVISRYIREKKEIKELNKVLKELHEKQASTGIKTAEEDKYEQDIIARRQRLWNDVHQIEVDNAKQITQLKEKYDASVAEEKIQEIIKTNEKEKQEYAKLLDDLYAIEKQKKSMEAAGAKVGDKAYDNILQQEQDLNNRISQLKAKHQKDLDEIRKKHDKKRNDDEVKAFIDAQKEKIKEAEKAQQKINAYNEKYGTISKVDAEAAIVSAKDAQNIAQHKKAIEDLQRVKAKLDNTDEDYFVTLKKVDKALKEHHKALRDAGVESNNLMQTHRGLMNIGGQLARRLALAFSVSQLSQYFRKLVEVRGQFEKTEVALTSIIGDNQKAQKLMNQTIALAIQSPFTLQQLTGYTKQLAAYQVSYEELHSTTKMLADVSAGLGVEMDRLILAFGQVKAANYLRATEIRQFTEAGFNILGELKDYYNDLNDTMLSVGDVQEMVTKRMVDFEDVAEIFKRVTQEGGRFYEMQSKQAETLAGQWTNLQDRIDVMLNEIGTDREGLLKGLVRMLASLIDNWEAIADVIKIVVGAFVLYKMNLLAVTKSQIANNLATQESIKLKIKEALAAKSLAPIYKNLSSSMRGFGSAMKVFGKANLWIAALTAVVSSVVSIVKHVQKMNEVVAEQDKVFNENTASLQKLSEKYKKATKEADAYNKKIKILQELSDKLEDRNLTLSVKIEEVDKTNIDKVFEENAERLQKAYDFGKDLGKAIAQGMNAAQGNLLGFSFFGENLKEDAEDYGKSMGKLMSWGMQAQMKNIENSARVNYAQMGKYAKEYYNSIKDGKRANESEYEWTKRRATALVMISKLEGDIVGKNKELQRTLRSVVSDGIELHHETKGIYNNLVEAAGGVANLRHEVSNNPIEMAAQIKTEVDKLDYDPATKQFIINDLYAMLHLKVNYVEDPNAQSPYQWEGFRKDLKESRDDLKKFVDENNKSLGYENFFFSEDEIKKLEEFSDALEAIQKLYDENNKTIGQLDGTSDAYSKAEKTRLEALQSELKEVAAKWNYDLDAKDKKGDNDALKRLKDQIKLIKDANKAYEERNKKFGKEDSKAVVTDSYKDAFKEVELAIEDIDYTNLEGVVAALESLEAEAKKAGGQVDLLKAISEVKAEIGLTLKERQDEVLFNQVQEIFDDYEFAIDIKKLNLPPELAKNLFGVDTKSFDQMRTEIISKFAGTNKTVSEILSKGYEVSAEDEKILIDAIGKERVDKAKEALEKIQDLEEKDQLERLKKYVEYAKKGVTERAKIKLEEMRQLEEIKKTFEAKDEDSEDVKAQKEDMANRASEKVRKESQEALNRLDWGEFEKSDMFIRVFDDLDSASTSLLSHLITKIQGFKDEWTDMPLEDVEKIIEALNKLQTKLAEANPWKEFKDAKKDFEEAKKAVKFEDKEAKELSEKRGAGNYMAALDKEDIAQQKVLDDANKQIAALEVQLATQEKIVATTEEEKTAKAQAIATTTKELASQKNIKKAAEDNLKATQKVRSEHSRVKTSLAAQYQTTSKCLDMAVELGSAFKDLVDVLAKDDPAMVFAEMGLNMLTTVANTLALQAQLMAAQVAATGLGAAMNTAAGVIGWIVMAIQLLVTAISAAVNYAEKMRQMKLDVLAGQVDNLKQKFDALAESIDNAWSIKQLKEYENELDRVKDKMISTQKDYISLLKSGKDDDIIELAKQAQEKLDKGFTVDDLSKKERKALLSEEYQNYKDATDALAEMEEDYADKKKEILESVGGVTDPHDAASEFVDAWLDAYKETGDGLKGLEDNFDEFFENLIKQKAARMLSDTLLTKWIDTINGALAEDSEGGRDLSDSEMADIRAAQEKAKGDINNLLKGLFEGLDINKDGGQLSSLQKGIQGITEDTAQIIEAYLNSVRGYVSEQVEYTKRLYEMFDRMSRGTTYGLNVRMIS